MTSTVTTRESTVKPVTIDKAHHGGYEVAPEVGSAVRLDCRDWAEQLLAGDDFTCPGYDGCDFRFPMFSGGPIKDVAINVHVTGRTSQHKWGARWVRVKIEWVGDCEPSTYCGGWMRV